MIERYGLRFPDESTDATIELECFARDWKEDQGGLGRYEHLHNAIDLLLNSHNRNHFIWNEWTEWMMREFCYSRDVGVTGAGSSWKTTTMACFGLMRWYSRPMTTRGIFTSTTLEGLRARCWKEVMHFYRQSGSPFGNPVNHPHPKIQTIKGDDGLGIFGIAVEAGDVDRAVENIKGRHAPNIFVGMDELTGISGAIVKAGSNLEKGCDWFQMIGLGNAVSHFDQHGLFCEPLGGWNSISVESDKWLTKRGGVAIHLDGLKAPNVKAGRKKYPGMLNQEDVEISRKRDGENSPAFWSQVRGFWAPEGIEKTVLTESIILRFKAREPATWVRTPVEVAACDPAFEGGDRRVLRRGKVGEMDVDGQRVTGLELGEIVLMQVDITRKDYPIHFQLKDQIVAKCEEWNVAPRNFGMDTTGEGGGLASILQVHPGWQEFLQVEFGGLPPDRPVSDSDKTSWKDDVVNRVTQLWYQFRKRVEAGQIRGLDDDTAIEFCQREYSIRGAKKIAESKADMKTRIGRSPDLADGTTVLTELCVVNGLLPNETFELAKNDFTWRDWARKMMPVSRYGQAA